MKHIIKMLHRVTEDQKGVFLSCEENGYPIFVSDMKKNGRFHFSSADGAPITTHAIHLFHATTQEHLLSFTPNPNSKYSGVFGDANNIVCGSIECIGIGSEKYYAADISGNHYDCYTWAVGTAPCMMFYKNGILKAMLVEDKLSFRQMYSMTIHIAEDEDVLILCMLGLIYHQFENVYNMNSRFHRNFVRNGYCLAFKENEANYRFEVPLYGVGKSKYNIEFLKEFYPPDDFPYQNKPVTSKVVVKELGSGFQEAAGRSWTEENLKSSLKNPVALILIIGVPILCAIIMGFVAANTFHSPIGFVIGFFSILLLLGIGEGIFFLFIKLLIKIFGKK